VRPTADIELHQTLNIYFAEDFEADGPEHFHYEPCEKEPVELGFVNEHVTFSDEESDHDNEREVIATLMSTFVTSIS
jgi:hypothetical protein